MADDDDEIILSELSDEELVPQMHDDLYDSLKDEVVEGVNILLERGWTPYDVLTKALVEGMRIVGIDFRDGILFVPEVLLAANAMKAGMAILKPLLVLFTLPFILLTMGLGIIVINALLFLFVGKLVDGFHVAGFWSAVGGALIVSVTNLVLSSLMRSSTPPRSPAPPAQTVREKKDDVIDI